MSCSSNIIHPIQAIQCDLWPHLSFPLQGSHVLQSSGPPNIPFVHYAVWEAPDCCGGDQYIWPGVMPSSLCGGAVTGIFFFKCEYDFFDNKKKGVFSLYFLLNLPEDSYKTKTKWIHRDWLLKTSACYVL